MGWASSSPIAQLSSSTVPMASMRMASLLTRLPSPRPVVPSSPVRVTILESLLPMPLRQYALVCERCPAYAHIESSAERRIARDLRALIIKQIVDARVQLQLAGHGVAGEQ